MRVHDVFRLWLAPILCVLASGLLAADVTFTLTGKQVVKPVTTTATGTGWIKVGEEDKVISGTIKTSGLVGVAAHLHMAPMGKKGPIILTLTKISDSEWSVPQESKLTDRQYEAFKAGHLYVNVHSAVHKRGEIRGQLLP